MKNAIKFRKDYQAPDFTVTDIFLDFQIDETSTLVTNTLQIKKLNQNAKNLILDGTNLTLKTVLINGEIFTDFNQNEHSLNINLANYTNDNLELTITTLINPKENTSLKGLYQSGEIICTQCEPEGFRRITFMLDRPDVLAKYRTKITACKTKYPTLLSNGNRIASGVTDNGKHWVEWSDPFAKPSYLFALVAGDFDLITDTFTTKSGRLVNLEIYVDKGNLDKSHWAMESLKRSMKWEEKRFNLEYDLDIYMIVAVDFFNSGAMENKGLNIFNSKYVLANQQTATDNDYIDVESVIAHEYFHNWTGNRITCRDWFQLSLKEGLTVFRDQEFTSDLWYRSVKRIEDVKTLRAVQFAEDASPTAHPIRPEQVIEMNNFYTATVYEKGAEVIRMLHTLIGEETFQKGMQIYINKFDGTAATCDDFVDAMQEASNKDLTKFRLWYGQSGTPDVKISDSFENKTYTINIEQNTKPTLDQKEKQALLIPLSFDLFSSQGVKLQSGILEVTEKNQTFSFKNIQEKPIPAFLNDFSAPVNLEYDYLNADLVTIIKSSDNHFTRWDIMQRLIKNQLQQNVSNLKNNSELELLPEFLEAIKFLLLDSKNDPYFASFTLAMPSLAEATEHFEVVNPELINQALEFTKKQIAQIFTNELLIIYNHNKLENYQVTKDDIGKRALRNLALSYLAYTTQGENLVTVHYQQANNMTDSLGALQACVKANLKISTDLLNDFENKWQKDALVMDKWFSLQALLKTDNKVEQIKNLLNHPSFEINNPNRVRSLIGTFARQNLVEFHNLDGSGYKLLLELLIKFNESNPQLAAALVEPMLKFARYEITNQGLMLNTLRELKESVELSPDLFEKVTKALSVVN